MRRLVVVLTALAFLTGGIFVPVVAQAASSPPVDVSRGSVTFTLGADEFGTATWNVSFAGTFALGGATYTGTASSPGSGGRIGGLYVNALQGTSATGSVAGSCAGKFLDEEVSVGQPRVIPLDNFTGIALFDCYIHVNGGAAGHVQVLVGLLPTPNAKVFKGDYVGTVVPPDVTRLPAVPLVSFGYAGAATGGAVIQDSPSIAFQYSGQISLGGRTFQGVASGYTSVPRLTTSIAVPPFQLTGASTTGALNATCSGQWVGTNDGSLVGAALSVITCNGAVDGGPSGSTALVSVYRFSGANVRDDFASYDGLYAGI
jgi:hypothetical protein